MAEKDIAEKNLESYNDVFADIVNVLIFGGKRVVKEKDLTDAKPVSEYNNEAGKKHYQERDVVKYWNNGEIRLSMLGIENQTKKDKFMPLRVMSYDAAAYRSQLLEKGIKQCYPIITLVLYFDTSRKWEENTSLKEVLSIPHGMEDFVNDYKIHVINLAWLETETVVKFKTGFREVIEYLQASRKGEPFNGSRRKVDHIIEIFNLLRVLSGSDRYVLSEEQIDELTDAKGGRKMYVDLVMKKRFLDAQCRGFAKGRMEGRREGMKEGREEGRVKGREEGREEGRVEGRSEGINEGIKSITDLFAKLFSLGRVQDVEKASNDKEYLKKLMEEYQK